MMQARVSIRWWNMTTRQLFLSLHDHRRSEASAWVLRRRWCLSSFSISRQKRLTWDALNQSSRNPVPDGSWQSRWKNGQVTLPAANLPVMGPFVASRRLILLFDYCCPHCREAHSVIRRLHATAGDEWQIVFVPTPLNSECNPGVEETEPRFKDACELARLSLAVWKLKPDDWPAFDAWLFEPELPRTAEEARQHAAALYGEIELAEALTKAPIDAVIAADVKMYQATGSRVLPVILSPGAAGIAGRTDGEDELRELLKKEFGFPTK